MEIGFYRFIFILMNFLDNICYKFYAFVAIFRNQNFDIIFFVQLIVYCDCKCVCVCVCKQCKYCKQFSGSEGENGKVDGG